MPTLSLGFDNLRTFAVTLDAADATLRCLPQYWPALNTMTKPFREFKAYFHLADGVRRAAIVPTLGTFLKIGAVALCMGNPADAFAAEIGIACHPIRETAGAASHCGLFIFARRLIRAQFSLAGGATRFNTDAAEMQADRAAFFKGYVYTIRAPKGETQEDFEKCVADWANRYRAPYYDAINGPNSNSAAAFPLIMSGAELPNVQQGILGAWQLNYWSFLRGPTAYPTTASPNTAVVREAQRDLRTRCRLGAARSRGITRRGGSATPAVIVDTNDGAIAGDRHRAAGRKCAGIKC
jgi:hypothetical protein